MLVRFRIKKYGDEHVLTLFISLFIDNEERIILLLMNLSTIMERALQGREVLVEWGDTCQTSLLIFLPVHTFLCSDLIKLLLHLLDIYILSPGLFAFAAGLCFADH